MPCPDLANFDPTADRRGERSRFSRTHIAFGAFFDHAPIDQVQARGIEEAKQRLETGGVPIKEDSAEVGYDDAAFFRRIFTRRVGLTSTACRRKFQRRAQLAQP